MIGDYKEVFFDVYCPTCKHWSKPEKVEPCCECMDNPAMQNSHKPMNYEKGDGDGKKKGCRCGCK